MPQSGADLIVDFMSLTEDALSPDLFRLWSGVSLVAGALERRVWLRNTQGPIIPNLFVLLIAPPGVGKSIINEVRSLWSKTTEPGTKIKAFNVAPDSMTKASLIDTIFKSKKQVVPPEGPLEYHSPLLVAAEEFGVLLPSYDMEYVTTLNSMWNNKELHHEVRRTGLKQDVEIERPQLNLLGGAQPAWLASVFPEDAWSTGIGRRMIMVYASAAPWKDVWAEREPNTALRNSILGRLGLLSKAYGQAKIERQVIEAFSEWDEGGRRPEPTHPKLVGYNNSRYYQTMKLAVVSAASRGEFFPHASQTVRIEDFARAKEWLLGAEKFMPDIFRAMLGKSDSSVLDELHSWTLGVYTQTKQKPIAGSLLRRFLLERVPHDKVESLLTLADKAHVVTRVAGSDDWVPKPRYGRGMP